MKSETSNTLSCDQANFNQFCRLFIDYEKDIYYASLCVSKDWSISEEVVQDTFIRGYTKLDTLKDWKKFKPWLIRIAINLTKNKLRNYNKILLIPNFSDSLPLIHPLHTDTEYTYNRFNDDLIKHEVLEMLNRLKPKYREVLILYYYHQMTYMEISKHLNIKIGTVKSRLSRAKEKYRAEIVHLCCDFIPEHN